MAEANKIDPKVTKAILTVRKAIKELAHDAENPHGNYTYASIDTYYKQVVPLASDAGLTWRIRQTSFVLIPNQGRNKDRTYVQVEFAFDVFVQDAESLNHMSFTVILPLEGAQTAGQMLSYADKAFMRSTFAIPTGEKDGDHVAPASTERPRQVPAVPAGVDPITGEILVAKQTNGSKPSELMDKIATVAGSTSLEGDPVLDARKIDETGIDTVVEVFRQWLPLVKTSGQLRDFHAQNLAAIDKVGQFSPEKRAAIKAMFNERNGQLKKETK